MDAPYINRVKPRHPVNAKHGAFTRNRSRTVSVADGVRVLQVWVCSESVGKTAIVRGEEIWQRPRSRLGTDAQ